MTPKELQFVLDEGEGQKIEFKEFMSSLDKELVAFANSSGGRVFIGVTDAKVAKGISITNRLKSQVQDTAHNCQPAIKIWLEEVNNVLVVHVPEGDDKPYSCSSGFYVRVGPNSQKQTRDQIIQFITAEGKILFDELNNATFDYEAHFDVDKLDLFMKRAGLPHALDVPATLVNLGVAERDDGGLIFNNAGVLFFAKHLKDLFRRTTVTCALFKGIDKVETLDRRDFNEDVVSSIDSAITVLKQWIPVRYEMTGTPQRREIPEIPYDALREAVINAVTHRDYFQKGANVMIEMFDDRIEISNPGGLVKGLLPEEFGRRSLLRNPNIANLLHEIKYIEKMGSGIPKMQRLIDEAGLPPVKFTFDTFFSVVFRRPVPEKVEGMADEAVITTNLTRILARGSVEGVNEGLSEGVKKRLASELLYVLQNGSTTRLMLQKLFSISGATVERDISLLRRLGLIRFEGAPKKGRYVLTEKGKLQNEAEAERTKILQKFGPHITIVWGHLGFDMGDPQTRLICKSPPQELVWTSPVQKTVHVAELYWRTKDGHYFKIVYDEEGATPLNVDADEVHYKMNTRTNYQWFITDAQKKELQAEDFELAGARSARYPTPENKDV
jgi:ATP-dependent DNA helicase RecG